MKRPRPGSETAHSANTAQDANVDADLTFHCSRSLVHSRESHKTEANFHHYKESSSTHTHASQLQLHRLHRIMYHARHHPILPLPVTSPPSLRTLIHRSHRLRLPQLLLQTVQIRNGSTLRTIVITLPYRVSNRICVRICQRATVGAEDGLFKKQGADRASMRATEGGCRLCR